MLVIVLCISPVLSLLKTQTCNVYTFEQELNYCSFAYMMFLFIQQLNFFVHWNLGCLLRTQKIEESLYTNISKNYSYLLLVLHDQHLVLLHIPTLVSHSVLWQGQGSLDKKEPSCYKAYCAT